MTLREIFAAIYNAISKAFNTFIDTDIFLMGGYFVMFVMGPYAVYKFFKSSKQPGGMITGIIMSLIIIFFLILFIKVKL